MWLSLFRVNGKKKASKLSPPVRHYLIDQFKLAPEYVDTLKCLESAQREDGRSLRIIQIFSPAMVSECLPKLRIPDDFQRHPEFVLYEGYVDERSVVHLSDRTRLSRSLGYLDWDDDLPERKVKTVWF